MLSTHVPCNCLGSINLRRPPIWDVKHQKTKKRIWMESISDANTPHHKSSQAKPTWGSEQQIGSNQQKQSSAFSKTQHSSSFTKPFSDISATDSDHLANLSLSHSRSAPFSDQTARSQTQPSTSPSAPSPYPAPSSYSSSNLRYPCLGAMNLRRPPIWDLKHVPVVRRISPSFSSASRISTTLSAAPKLSPSSISSNTSSMNRISSTISSTSLVQGLKGFTMSIFDQAWVLTDVAKDWLSPQSHVIVAEEKSMKNEEEDEGIMIDEPFTFDYSSMKDTTQIGSPSQQSDCRKRKVQLQIDEGMMSEISRSDKDSDSSSDSEVSIDSGIDCSSPSTCWAEPESKKKKYGSEM